MEDPGIGLLAVHAHPDDEVIATGGVLAQAADAGRGAAVVTCTGGELGEIVGEGMDPEEVRPRLGEVRRGELAAALDLLGAGPPRLLGYRDSGMRGEESNGHPAAFWRADVDEAVGRVVAVIRELRPEAVVTYDAFGIYGHPDHVQAHRVAVLATTAAALQSCYPEAGPAWQVRATYLASVPRSTIARFNALLEQRGLPSPFGDATDPDMIVEGVPDALVTHRIDVRDVLDRKWAALRAHASQIGPDSLFLNVPPDLAEEAFGVEWFCRLGAPPRAPDEECDDDLLVERPRRATSA